MTIVATAASVDPKILRMVNSPRICLAGDFPPVVSWGRLRGWQVAVDSQCAYRGPSKAQIFPCLRLVGQVAQEVGRMVCHDQRHRAVTMNPYTHAGDGGVDVEQRR